MGCPLVSGAMIWNQTPIVWKEGSAMGAQRIPRMRPSRKTAARDQLADFKDELGRHLHPWHHCNNIRWVCMMGLGKPVEPEEWMYRAASSKPRCTVGYAPSSRTLLAWPERRVGKILLISQMFSAVTL